MKDDIFEKMLEEFRLDKDKRAYPTNCTMWIYAMTRIRTLEIKLETLQRTVDAVIGREDTD